MVPFCG